MTPIFRKMNFESFSSAWKSNLCCEDCSIRLNVFRKKKVCFFCNNSFCQVCIIRREDRKFCCKKCQILTARPLDRNELLNLRSRDLVNYLTSRHIPVHGCIEKEDLVDLLIDAVNNSCFHPSSSVLFDSDSCTNSYQNSPEKNTNATQNLNSSTERLSCRSESVLNENGVQVMEPSQAESDHFSPTEQEDLYENVEIRPVQRYHFSPREQENVHNLYENVDFANVTDDTLVISGQENQLRDDLMASEASIGKNDYSELDEGTPSKKPLLLSEIKSFSDLENLSVKQLKDLLMRNRTDFKGCIERADLILKANRLWEDYKLSRKDLENINFNDLCKICMDEPIECVLLECGHMATCTSCGKQLRECPICRQFVVRCVRTFKA